MLVHTLRRKSPERALLLIFSSLLLMFFSAWQIFLGVSVINNWTVYVFICFLIWFLIYVFVTYKHFGTVFLFTTAYIICLSVFHLGHVGLYVFGAIDFLQYESGIMAVWLEKAGWVTLLALGSIGVGMGLSFGVLRREGEYKEIQKNHHYVFWVGVGLLVASLAALALTVMRDGNILQYSRTEVFQGALHDIRGLGFFLVGMPSAVILMVVGAVKRLEKFVSYPLAIATFLLLLGMGYRSSALFSFLIGAIIWVKLGRRIPIYISLLVMLFVMVAIPTVRELREQGAWGEMSQEQIIQSYESTSSKEVFLELGGTLGIVANVLMWIPEEESFRYGNSYIWAVSTMLPNFGLSESSSPRQRKPISISNDDILLQEGNPSDWYIYRTNKWKYENGLGSGFSGIAEPYINFGYPGVVVFFLSLGFFLGKLEHVDLRQHPKALLFSGGMLWPLFKTVRNSSVVFFKPLSLVLIAIIIWRILTFWKKIWNLRVKKGSG